MESRQYVWSAVLCLLLMIQLQGTACSEAELRLITSLMEHYDSDVRPSVNVSQSVVVRMDLTMHQIVELDEKNQVLTCSIWQRLYWRDEHLKWNRSDYDNLGKIRISPDRVWRPDIALVNDIRSEEDGNLMAYPMTVMYDGNVSWLAPRLIRSSCTLDMTYFPWDFQTCILHFSSWTHDDDELSLTNYSTQADDADYLTNGQWALVGLPVTRFLQRAPCCEVPFSNLHFDIQLRRRARYYIGNLIFPSALITSAGMLVFCVPAESGEKVSLSVTILLATTVYQLLLAERMPVQSMTTPIISRYIMASQILLGLSTMLTILVLNLYHKGSHGYRMPRPVRKVVRFMACVLCLVNTANRVLQPKDKTTHKRNQNERAESPDRRKMGNVDGVNENSLLMSNNHGASENRVADVTSGNIVIHDQLKRILQTLSLFESVLDDQDDDDSRNGEWMFAANVLDRFFLIVFAICVFVCSVALLLGHQHYRMD